MVRLPAIVEKIDFLSLCPIDLQQRYLPGKLALTFCKDIVRFPFSLLIWKIDDPMWILHTTNRDRISINDPDWRSGVYSFTRDSGSWSLGVEVNLLDDNHFEETILLRQRILKLTEEFGINIDYEEFEVTGTR